MAQTIYKGDLAEVTLGHETGIVLTSGAWGGLVWSHTTPTNADHSIITFKTTANHTSTGMVSMFDTSHQLKYPKGLLAGSKLRITGAGAYGNDDHTKGNVYTIIANEAATITVTPALKTAVATDSTHASTTTRDEITIETLGTPTIDAGMVYNSNAQTSDESVLTDQFIGLAATITLPETKVEVFRSHIVGIGRQVVVQEPQHIDNEGGSLETIMHSARWLYYALGNEAVRDTTAGKGSLSRTTQAIGMGDTYVGFAGGLIQSDATCDTTNTDATVTMDSTATIVAGTPVSGTGIPTGATVASITNATTFELSAAATATNTNTTLTFGAWPARGDYIQVTDTTEILTPYAKEPTTKDKWGTTGTETRFHSSVRTETRRVVAVDITSGYVRVYVDDPFNFDHVAGKTVTHRAFAIDDSSNSPEFVATTASYGTITNRQKRAMWSMWHQPSFCIETSMRTRDVGSYGTEQVANAPGTSSDSKQLTRLYKGCKVKSWSLTADADSEVKMKVDFDALMCYTDTGRLENSNPGDRYTAHRMFENIANGLVQRKEAGIAPNTEKPFFFYNGTITAFGSNIAQVTTFDLGGENNVEQHLVVRGNPLAESRNTAGQSLEQIPFAGSRNPSLAVEGKVVYNLKMTVLPTDPLLWHEFRAARSKGYGEPITLHLMKDGAGSNREEVYVIIDDYIITEAPLAIPEDKGVIKQELTILPKHVKVISYDSLYHC